jgi:hypothetical protein
MVLVARGVVRRQRKGWWRLKEVIGCSLQVTPTSHLMAYV